MRWRTLLVGAVLAALALSTAAAAPLAGSFTSKRPVIWVSVAEGQPSHVWVETADGGALSSDSGRSFHAPLSTNAFRRAQVAQAALLADGKTLLAMPTVWSAQQFTPPLRSTDGGGSWHAGALKGADAHYDFGAGRPFVGEYPVTPDPVEANTAWFCQGNLYVTHDAGLTWSVATPRFKRPWHCTALAIARGKAHTLLLLAQATGKNSKRTLGRLQRSTDGGATWHAVKAPRYPQLAYNGHALAFDPKDPATALMLASDSTSPGSLYRSADAGLTWSRVRPAGTLHGAITDQFAFTSDGRALALVRIGSRQSAAFTSLDGGLHWGSAPALKLGATSPSVYVSPLAASGTSFLLGTNRRGFWRLAPEARRWVGP